MILTIYQKFLLSINLEKTKKIFPSLRSIIHVIFLRKQDELLFKDEMGLRAHHLRRFFARYQLNDEDLAIMTK